MPGGWYITYIFGFSQNQRKAMGFHTLCGCRGEGCLGHPPAVTQSVETWLGAVGRARYLKMIGAVETLVGE
jgi:hypothetical protein